MKKQKTKPKSNKQLQAEVKQLESALATIETDATFFSTLNTYGMFRERDDWDREKILAECLRAWRVNPLARRIVKLITSFVIGGGIELEVDADEATNNFLQEWLTDEKNNFRKNFKRWLDEQSRAGNLFHLWTVIPSTGMTYVRAVPAEKIKEIVTKPNDIEQETKYIQAERGAPSYPAFDENKRQDLFMTHDAVNQPVGVSWGEPDLATILPWLGRYSTLLEDRVRLNHFRTAIMYILKLKGEVNTTVKQKREAQMNANPPRGGTTLVMDETEGLGILSATLDSFDATLDIQTVKKMIASGTPFPLHYLSEPESATRTTAEAAGTPTFRALQDIQDDFFAMIKHMAKIALIVRARVDKKINPNAEITVKGADITEKDNSNLALALNRINPTLMEWFDREFIDAKEVLRIGYRFIAEIFNKAKVSGLRRPLKPVEPSRTPASEPDSGDDDNSNEE